ncbi:movement protein [water chestnut virus A]|uniref:Movement protein n=1 Tax=water chestnut virus A TaxID=2884706 RepID=A0A8K1ND08_9BROM|nr:movement protein [water chestnut virus A]
MAFTGNSRTLGSITQESKNSTNATTSAFEFSQEDWRKTLTELDEFYQEVMIKNLPTKLCYKLDLRNNVPIEPLLLKSKEKKNVLQKLGEKVRGCVYTHHSIIFLIYIPTMLESTAGVMTLKLFNLNTQETVDIDTEAPANEACVFVTRWPRSVHADDGDGICLIPSVVCQNYKQGAIAGTVFPVWDDSIGRKKLYEKEYPTLRFPIEKTTAMAGIRDINVLRSYTKQRMLGGNGVVDIDPQMVNVRGEAGKKAKTVIFKRSEDTPSSSKDPTPISITNIPVTDKIVEADAAKKEGITSDSHFA